jgi:hypothetical protein
VSERFRRCERPKLLGQAAELPQPRLYERKQALSLVNMDSLWRYVRLFVHDRSVVTLHFSVSLESVGPELSQRLGKVFSLLNYWFKISLAVDTELATDHTTRVAARRRANCRRSGSAFR